LPTLPTSRTTHCFLHCIWKHKHLKDDYNAPEYYVITLMFRLHNMSVSSIISHLSDYSHPPTHPTVSLISRLQQSHPPAVSFSLPLFLSSLQISLALFFTLFFSLSLLLSFCLYGVAWRRGYSSNPAGFPLHSALRRLYLMYRPNLRLRSNPDDDTWNSVGVISMSY
jgi:hypothetical protein